MFERRVDGEVALALLEEQHAPDLFHLLDVNRAYLRQWLPWLDQHTKPADTAAYVFGDLGLHHVEIACAPGNIRSCAIAERLGSPTFPPN